MSENRPVVAQFTLTPKQIKTAMPVFLEASKLLQDDKKEGGGLVIASIHAPFIWEGNVENPEDVVCQFYFIHGETADEVIKALKKAPRAVLIFRNPPPFFLRK
jgi:hypothetical protein